MPTEQQILKLIQEITPNSKKYLHDDAAVIEKNLVVTTDTLVENTHFTLKNYTPEEIGYKALIVNLSDIAAMGAKPLYALVSLSLPKTIKLSWIKRLYKGINNCAEKYKTQIIGGNLTGSKEINITIAVIGKLVSQKIAKRSNAKSGDFVFVTGVFGYASKKPIPQIKVGQKIVKLAKQVALMDSSDGLADCLIQIANESNAKIIIDEDKIPVKKSSLNLALYGGEDYQLVGTASVNDCKKLKKLKEISIIGRVEKGESAYLRQNKGRLVKLSMKKVFKHFS